MLIKILIFFLICIIYKLICSIIDLIKVKYYKKLYISYLSNKSSKIFQYKTSCITLFKKLNISDAKIPITQKTGYGQLANFTTSLFNNFPDNTTLFTHETLRIFQDAIGICKTHIFECLSIRYWINCIIFLPKNILCYLNVSAESIFIKICQVIYWISGILITLFSTDIYNIIKSLIMR